MDGGVRLRRTEGYLPIFQMTGGFSADPLLAMPANRHTSRLTRKQCSIELLWRARSIVFDKEHTKITKDVDIELAHTLGHIVNCSGNDEQLINCMRGVSAYDLLSDNAYTYEC